MGLHRLVEKVLTGIQFGTSYADELRAIPYARAGPFVMLVDAQPPELSARTSGTVFVSRGASPLVILLPPISTIPSGVYWDFYNAVDENLVLDSDTNELLGYGADAEVALLRSNTANELTGWGVRFISDGTIYIPMIHLGDADQTIAHIS